MNCLIPGANLKVLGKALNSLAKIGDELHIEAKKDQLSLIILNSSKIVCGRFNFSDTFFSNYTVDTNELTDENDFTLKCKVHLKIFLPLFKGNIEKKLDFFQIEYESSQSDFILFKMKYKCDNLLMVHKLRLMESEDISLGIRPDYGSNHLRASSTFFNQFLSMFNVTDDEITMDITKSKIIVRNYCVGTPCRPKMLRTQINLNSTEFQKYKIEKETNINFTLKPLRTIIQFGEIFNLDIEFNFEVGGKPLSMLMYSPTFNVNFMVATCNPCNDGNSSFSESIFEKRANNNNNIKKLTTSLNRSSQSQEMPPSLNTSQETPYEDDNDENATPLSKKARTVFGNNDRTFHQTIVGDLLVGNSDSE